MKITLIILAVLVLWSVWGYFGSRVEQADYQVLDKKKDYEIRNYPARIVAQTTVSGAGYMNAMNSGFSIVARYIFGANVSKEKISMTAPVIEKQNASEKISMTSPVMVTSEEDSRVIAFGMPRAYTMENLPAPTDPRVKIQQVPAQQVAVLRFSGFRSESRIQKNKDKLLAALARDGVETVGAVSYAGYNAPWTPPWMNRNEVLIEIAEKNTEKFHQQ